MQNLVMKPTLLKGYRLFFIGNKIIAWGGAPSYAIETFQAQDYIEKTG
jgi:hypothetical protein